MILKRWLTCKKEVTVLDVRSYNEWNTSYIEGSVNMYVSNLEKTFNCLPRNSNVVIICKTGNRSSFTASVLLRKNFNQIYNCPGGLEAWS